MSTTVRKSSTDNSPDIINIQALIAANFAQEAKNSEKNGDSQAALALLSQTLEELLEQTNPDVGKSSNGTIASAPSQTSANEGPSDAQMQAAIGQLMALLTTLECMIAKFSNQNAQSNSSIGQAMMQEMQAQVQQATEEMQKAAKDENRQKFWSIFTKTAEAVVGVALIGVALLCGQPELAAVILVFTVLAATGGMSKMTEGLGNALSAALVKMGVPKDTADVIGKVLADVIVIAASILITAATCGAGAGTVAQETTDIAASTTEELVEEGTENCIEMTDFAAEGADSVSQATQSAESFTQKLSSFFSKVGNYIKNNNPFNKVPRNLNLGIVAGSQALCTSNFGNDLMTAAFVHMKDGKTKEALETTLGTIINLLAALAGAGAGAAVTSGPAVYQLGNTALAMKAFIGLGLAGGTAQFSGYMGSGVTDCELASNINDQGKTQASIQMLQGLTKLNNQQASSDSKALSAKMNTWATELSSLSYNLNLAGSAVARELQA